MNTWSHVENIGTLVAAATVILGLYAMGAGAWSASGFVILLNLNYICS